MIEIGDRLPEDVYFFTLRPPETPEACSGQVKVSYSDLFPGRTVVLVGIPGAFTPVCTSSHIPGFLSRHADLKAAGVDTIACTAVNDAYAMEAWRKDLGIKRDEIAMLADGNGSFTKRIGMEIDLRSKGMGARSQRFAMIVKDGMVKYVGSDGEGGEVKHSSVDVVLSKLR